ncbi:MAG: RHS repeat-associated core domain-containing protein [Bacteroidota bacterium]
MKTQRYIGTFMPKFVFTLIVCTLLFQFSSYAGSEKETLRVVGGDITSTSMLNVITLEENKYSGLSGYSNIGKVKLGFDHYFINDNFSQDYTVSINLDVESWDAAGIKTTHGDYDLQVTYNMYDSYIDVSQHEFTNCHKISVIINSISVAIGTQTPSIYTNLGSLPFFYLNLEVETSRYYTFDPYAITSSIKSQSLLESNEIEIFWDIVPGAETYDLEWTFVDDYEGFDALGNITYIDILSPQFGYNFKLNSTRISTSNNYYSISQLFEHGYVLYRVRAVGLSELSETVMVPGEWTLFESGNISNVPAYQMYKITDEHETNKPWTYSASFAENGLKKETASYFDGSLRNRQTVSVNNTQKEAVVQENIYDYLGRPAITTLPAPAVGSSLKYYSRFNLSKESSLPYSWSDFDKAVDPSCNAITQPMSEENGAEKYYSPNSNYKDNIESFQEYLPMSNGYPFIQTEYTPDNTGRISRVGGLGPDMQLSTLSESKHETSYFYGQPNQVDLDKLFGNDVGFADHYKKNMTIDPNGQIAVVYTDLNNKTIATALAGEHPNSLEPIYTSVPTDKINELLIDEEAPGSNNMIMDESIEFAQEFLVTTSATYGFTYTITPGQFTPDPCDGIPLCFDGIYHLEFSIIDVCGNERIEGGTQTYEIGDIGSGPNLVSCNLNAKLIIEFETDQLEIGKYTLSKKLVLDHDALTTYIEAYMTSADNGCLPNLDDIIYDATLNINNDNCNIDCSDGSTGCIESLGTTFPIHLGLFGEDALTEPEYDAAIAECISICGNNTTPSTGLFEMLCADMYPGGQYALYDNNSDGSMSADIYELSVLNTSDINQLSAQNSNWKNPNVLYLDDNGNPAYVVVIPYDDPPFSPMVDDINSVRQVYILDDGTIVEDPSGPLFITIPNNLANLKDFVVNFQKSWAEALVMYHPEFVYFTWVQTLNDMIEPYDESSSEFDSRLLQFETFSDASNPALGGFTGLTDETNITDLLTADPYFDLVSNSDLYNEMLTWLTDIDEDGPETHNLKQLIAALVRCSYDYEIDLPSVLDPCCNFGYDEPNPYPDSDVILNLDKEWKLYRDMYLQMKQSLQKKEAHNYAKITSPFGYNGCIGVGNDGFDAIVHEFETQFSADPDNYCPCHENRYQLFANKTRRYITNDEIVQLPSGSDDPATAGHELEQLVGGTSYLETGQCPITNELAVLFSSLASNGDFIGNTDLMFYPEFSESLYNAMNDVVGNNVYEWNSTISPDPTSNLINIKFGNQGTASFMDLDWYYSQHPDCDWSSILNFFNFQYIEEDIASGIHKFRVTAYYHTPADVTGQVVLYGETDININGCVDDIPYEIWGPTQFALDWQALMNEMVDNNEWWWQNDVIWCSNPELPSSSCISSGIGDYDEFIPQMVDQLSLSITEIGDDDDAGVGWYCKSEEWQLICFNHTLNEDAYTTMVIEELDGFPLGSTGILYFKDIRPIPMDDQSHHFRMTAVCDIGSNGIIEEFNLEGSVYQTLSSDPTINPINIDMVQPIAYFLHCDETEVKVKEDLEGLLNYIAQNGPLTTQCSLDNVDEYTDLLKSYMTATEWSIPTILNYKLSGAFYTTFCPPNPTYLNLQPFNCNDVIDYSTVTAFQNMTAIYTDNTNGITSKEFIVDAITPNGVIKLYGSTNRFPLQNCNDCFDFYPPYTKTQCYIDYASLTNDLTTLSSSGIIEDVSVFLLNEEDFCALNLGYSGDDYIFYLSELMNTGLLDVDLVDMDEPFLNSMFIALDEYSYNGYSHSQSSQSGQDYYSQFLTTVQYIHNNLLGDNLVIGDSKYFLSLPEFHKGNFVNCIECYNDYVTSIQVPIGGNAVVLTIDEYTDGNLCTKIPMDDCPKLPSNLVLSPQEEYVNPCQTNQLTVIDLNAYNWYYEELDQIRESFIRNYKEQCLLVDETLNMEYYDNEYHYTLYYYDLAGNLVKTVPPEGVSIITSQNDLEQVYLSRNNNTTPFFPDHYLETNYKYNSRGLLIEQITPDAGKTTFEYDDLGRIIRSQNAKQIVSGDKSYTRYDENGRIDETGEINYGELMGVITKKQITLTHYDAKIELDIDFEQTNLRNRVASVTYDVNGDGFYEAATHYSYDIHGNVSSMVQENKEVSNTLSETYKQIDYEYDLVSGNVNKVSYQAGKSDAFYHKYEYDADNRITDVYTSIDNEVWQRDAKYIYYKHGPLARVELGHNKVQGIDYAYTINGWLKGVNSNTLVPDRDIGKDGSSELHRYIGEDAFGYSLGYYYDDYEQIKAASGSVGSNFLARNGDNLTNPLYNGNISSMVTAIFNTPIKKHTGELIAEPFLSHYSYDQLNRLSTSNVYTNENVVTINDWAGYSNPGINAYNTKYTYDANGNIVTLTRNGTPLLESMDKLSYVYEKEGTKLLNNKLLYVDDLIAPSSYDDIDDQNPANYEYDNIGNLILDVQSEIDNITWNISNKITRINRLSTSEKEDLSFSYDGMGNRIMKTSWRANATIPTYTNTWYVRDAQGNIMATYTFEKGRSPKISEQYIYGSTRLGYVDRASAPTGTNTTHAIGLRQYELANHLGNIITTVSDRPDSYVIDHNTWIEGYTADVKSRQDYYAFGSLMPGRQSNPESYRFGFNGKEMDNEVSGNGNQYDYGFRIYNPRIGRFLSVDPLFQSYPWYTPYQFAGNKPIWAIDIDGLEEYIYLYKLDDENNATLIKKVKNTELKPRMNSNGTFTGYSDKFNKATGLRFTNSEVGTAQYQYYNDNGDRVIKRRDLTGEYVPGENELMQDWTNNIDGSVYIGSNNPPLFDGQNDYRREPQDGADAIAEQHDKDFDIATPDGLKGLKGTLSHKSTPANNKAVKSAELLLNKKTDNVTGKDVTEKTKGRAKWILVFKTVERWKNNEVIQVRGQGK